MTDSLTHWSAETVADILGVTRGRISQLLDEGTLTRDAEGFEKDRTFRDAMIYYRGLTDIAAIKRLMLEKKTELLQIEVDKAKGKVMQVEDVHRVWGDIVIRARDAFRRLGSKVSPVLPYCRSEAEMQKKVEEATDEILNELCRPVDYVEKAAE